MICKRCGREISENARTCPNCGTAVTTEVVKKRKPVSAIAIIGFILSLASIYLGVYYCIAPVIVVILNIVALALWRKFRLNGFAIAGLIISLGALCFWGVAWMFIGALIEGLKGITIQLQQTSAIF